MAAAVGISGNFLNRAAVLQAVGVDFFCVDVAHGHHILMKEAIETLRDTFGDSIHIMAGNVATLEGINDLADWGADSVRCNIGGGSICSTRTQTGHGLPGLQTIFECAKTDRNVAIIADGGIFEGVSSRVPYRGQVLNILEDLERGIRSGFSYSGAHNLSDLHAKATFVRQTTSGISESNTHIVGRNW